LDNQMIFISAKNGYLKTLAEEEVLDKNYNNTSFINVAKQREMWVAINPLAKDWDDTKVKNMSYKKSMFVAGDIKILQSITNLNFAINMV
ncbi:phage tail sheath protein, partial [Clostridium sp. CF012]